MVQLTEYNSSKESKLFEIEADLARCQAACTRVTQVGLVDGRIHAADLILHALRSLLFP
ncbi:hypothetical protein HPP92_016740 [Vanilla planifolia]|uniref:Uncharacterized protein n=1 Tax=Vanilla planifolia TaxID=51239 RepID=A0A835UQS1_VANPL|nr:hypothetical protein HPP92_016740 [Vanilla planifolia]